MDFICSHHHAKSKDGRLSLIHHRMEPTDKPFEGIFDFRVVVDGQEDGYGLLFSDAPIDGMSALIFRLRTPRDIDYFLSLRDALSRGENDLSFLQSIACAIVDMYADARLLFDTRYIVAIDQALAPTLSTSLPELNDPSIPPSFVLASRYVSATNFDEIRYD